MIGSQEEYFAMPEPLKKYVGPGVDNINIQ